MRPRKTLMNKKAYRLKFRKSCDFADCGIMLLEVAAQKGFTIEAKGGQAAVSVVVDTNRRIEEINQLSQEVDFSSENEKEEWAPEGADDFDYAYDD